MDVGSCPTFITSAVTSFHYWYNYNKTVGKCLAGVNLNGNIWGLNIQGTNFCKVSVQGVNYWLGKSWWYMSENEYI